MTVVSTFYKFAEIKETSELRGQLREVCSKLEIRGTILIAPEGINATVAGARASIDRLLEVLRKDCRFSDLETKESLTEEPPFGRMRVRLKREIISIRDPFADPTIHVGQYVDSAAWNKLLDDPDVLVVDTRNDYEVEAGTFSGAVDPGLKSFGQFPDYVRANLDPRVHKKVAMFCTGGIRCEKASALLLSQGFESVFHLKGGILRYLAETADRDNRFSGECFVFDDRGVIGPEDVSTAAMEQETSPV